jgi:hypothetical protein
MFLNFYVMIVAQVALLLGSSKEDGDGRGHRAPTEKSLTPVDDAQLWRC